MAKNFRELEKKLSPARRKRIAARVKELKADIASVNDEVAAEGIKDLCGIQICENCGAEVDPYGDNCAKTVLLNEEEVFAHKICPLPKNS